MFTTCSYHLDTTTCCSNCLKFDTLEAMPIFLQIGASSVLVTGRDVCLIYDKDYPEQIGTVMKYLNIVTLSDQVSFDLMLAERTLKSAIAMLLYLSQPYQMGVT